MPNQRLRPLVGRERERELIRAALDDARAGAGRVVLVAGEPGAGKTRLAEDAVASGPVAAWGRATEEVGSPPYWPFQQAFRALRQAGVMPAEALDAFSDPRPDPARLVSAAEERFRRFEAIVDALFAAAAPHGLLLVLDDLHWADTGSTQLLVHIARAIGSSRLAIVATYRDTETVGQEPLRAALAELGRESFVSRIRLSGLTPPDVAAHLGAITGWPVPDSVAAAVCRRTRGNPFFVEELGRVLADSRDGELPDGVRDAVRARLVRLSPDCRAIVTAAAVLGSAVAPPELAVAAQRGVEDVLAGLDEAGAAGIVSGPPYAFAHDLIREAARLDVSTTDRLGLHERLGRHLASRSGADWTSAEVAFHLCESLPLGPADEARAWAQRAGDQAMAQSAWEEAGAWYARALAAGDTDPSYRAELLISRARAQIRAYDVDGARQSLSAAVDLARRLGNSTMIAEAVLVMEGVTDFIWDHDGRTLCEEALAGLPGSDSALRARLLAQIVAADLWANFKLSDQRSLEALAMAERVADRHAIVESLRARQIVRGVPDGATDRLAVADRLLALGDGADPDAAMWGHLWRFDAYAQLGEIDRAEAELPAVAAAAGRLRSPLARWHAVRVQATMDMARGRFAAALANGREAEALARRADHDGTITPSIGFMIGLAAQLGDPELLPDEVEPGEFGRMASGFLSGMHATWSLAFGDRVGAHRIYRQLPSLDAVPPFVRMSAMGGMAELAGEFEDRDLAADIYRRLLPWADYFVCGGAGVVMVLGSARMPLGIAAATVGRLDDAVAHLRAAVERNAVAGMPPAVGFAKLHLARTLARRRRPGDVDEAAAVATSARSIATELGMQPLARDCTTLLDRVGGGAPGPLTPREREVAALVAQGLTNRQIAASAHISERTAESHVQHILTKLGFATRTQIASWVATEMRTGSP